MTLGTTETRQSSPRRLQWPAALLLAGLALLSSMAAPAADWADHLGFLPIVALLGVAAGLALAHSRFPGWWAAITAAAYGLFVTGWLLGQTLDPALAWRQRALALSGRLRVFLDAFAEGRENADTLVLVLLFALLTWGLSAASPWWLLRRRSPWGAILPLGIVLLVNAFYYFGDARLDLLLAGYIGLSILLLLEHQTRQARSRWLAERARVQPTTQPTIAAVGLVFVLLLVSLSFVGPAFARSDAAGQVWDTVSAPWRAVRGRLENALKGLRSPVAFVGEDFSDSLVLEAGVEPNKEVVLEAAPQSNLVGSGRFYWRARTYDRYADGRWTATQDDQAEFDPREDQMGSDLVIGRETTEVLFAVHNAVQQVLYVPAQPTWVSRTAEIEGVLEGGRVVDVAAITAQAPMFAGETYRAMASIATPTASMLRRAGSDYPDWVRDRYLQVPAGMSERTLELARRIVGDLDSPYDQAAALTAWLRSNIEYRRVTEAPPAGVEPLDWFLFEYGIGFCNYYASADVMMLRSLGVPARLAVGYTRGNFDASNGVYTVTGAEYHAWPEVFFPGYGWVEFEPTVSEPPLTRPEGAADDGQSQGGPRSGQGSRGELDALRLERMEDLLAADPTPELGQPSAASPGVGLARWAIGGLAMIMAAIWVWTRLDASWSLTVADWRSKLTRSQSRDSSALAAGPYSTDSTPLQRAYIRWIGWWGRIGLQARPDQTAHERASLFGRLYPEMSQAAETLASDYASERFRPAVSQNGAGLTAARQLQRHALQMWIGRLSRSIWQRLQRPDSQSPAGRQIQLPKDPF